MLLLTKQITSRLLNAPRDNPENKPLVKLFTPDANCTWLLSEFDADGDTLFGLCDLGQGSPELGYVSLQELQTVRGALGLPVERDLHFKATQSLAAYHEEALARGGVFA